MHHGISFQDVTRTLVRTDDRDDQRSTAMRKMHAFWRVGSGYYLIVVCRYSRPGLMQG